MRNFIWGFAFLLPLISDQSNGTQSAKSPNGDTVKNRRSNYPCGKAFVPCEFDAEALGIDEKGGKIEKPSLLDQNSKQRIQFAAFRMKNEVDTLFNRTEQQIFNDYKATNFLFSTLAWNDLMGMDRYAKDMSYSAMVVIKTTQTVMGEGIEGASMSALSAMPVHETVLKRVCPLNVIADCIPGKYRTYSGHCNNIQTPLWGAMYEPMQRLGDVAYADGVSTPRAAQSGAALPSARRISRSLFRTAATPDRFCSLMLSQWGQFVFSDLVQLGSHKLFGDNQSIPLPCCATEHSECLPVITDADDLPYKNRGQCIPYSRTFIAPRENCNLGVREQANLASSFLDASQLYGSTAEVARRLRAFRDGQLLSVPQSGRRELPPPRDFGRSCASKSAHRPCFDSASPWTNLLPTNAAFHTLWLRQHNTVAAALHQRNRHWDDERLFQESRRIVAAQIQHITFAEFLPIIVGMEQLNRRGLQLRRRSFDSGYNMKANPSVLNEYASAVGFFFFTLLPDSIAQISDQGMASGAKHLSSMFNDPSILYNHDKVEAILRFLIHEPVNEPRLRMSDELRERLFRGADQFGIDLAALIVQMGRDHGIGSYAGWRERCALRRPRDFDDLRALFVDPEVADQIREVYESVEDVDLFVGGLAERPDRGAFMGPTFSCILAQQFERARHGDRFWYENFFQPSAFTEEQLTEIRKTTLAAILCDNTDNIGTVQPNVFRLADNYGNCPMRCNTTAIVRPNLDAWLDQEPKRRLPITQDTLEKALRMGAEQFRRLQEAERRRQLPQTPSPSAGSAIQAHAALMAPKRESLDRAQAAGILRETTKVLLRGTGLDKTERLPVDLDVSTLQQLLPQVDVSRVIGNVSDYLDSRPNADRECLPKPMPCDHTAKYRSASGWCNNLRFPSYGNAFEPLRRIVDPAYDDGFDSPRSRGRNGRSLPSARSVSVALHDDNNAEDSHFSHMLMQMGQIIDHDFTHSPLARGPGNAVLNCSRCDSFDTLSIHCFPIRIEAGDPHFPKTHSDGTPRCMAFTRSLLGQVTLGYRNQLNQLTSFMDASHVYGSTECESHQLRLFSLGKLNFTDLGFNKEALPQGAQERDCRTKSNFPCFNAGDERNNIQPGLATIHTIQMREHNRVAGELHRLNPFWTDEKLYQEARRVLVAKLQHIVYNEWLPIVLGCETMARYDLMPKRSGYYDGYDAACDAAVSQEFSTAAFRFGHTLIRNVFPRMDADYNKTAFGDGIELRHNFNNATAMYEPTLGHMESIIMGLLGSPAMTYDRHISSAVRNHLFQKLGGPFTGLDLIAVNIQRARDHGIPGYNAYREMCGLAKAVGFDDLSAQMDADAVAAFRRVYGHVDDIDLFSGIMAERPMRGALVGPTVACIIAEQFQRAKRCDRFYYETSDPSIRFTPAQLTEIRKSTFSKMICQNSEYARKIQPNAFLLPDDLTNAPIHCEEMLDTDLEEWMDRQFCLVDQRLIYLGKTKRVTPCITCTCTADGTECHSMTVENCDDLLKSYSVEEIRKDTVCMIQCARALGKNRKPGA